MVRVHLCSRRRSPTNRPQFGELKLETIRDDFFRLRRRFALRECDLSLEIFTSTNDDVLDVAREGG